MNNFDDDFVDHSVYFKVRKKILVHKKQKNKKIEKTALHKQ